MNSVTHSPAVLASLPPVHAVAEMMRIGGQSIHRFNAQQATMYIGLMLEELRETLACVAAGQVDHGNAPQLEALIGLMNVVGAKFKSGLHMGDVARADRAELLDGMIDTAVVSFGAAISISNNAAGAWREVMRANFSKFPDGVALRDANGKIMKPAGWTGPDLLEYISTDD